MEISFQPPPADLRSLVQVFWKLDSSESPPPASLPRRVLPDGSPELIVHLSHPSRRLQNGLLERDPPAFVFGQLERYIDLFQEPDTQVVGARLNPAALARLTRTSAYRFTGRPVGLDDLWGTRGTSWQKRLLACGSSEAALAVLTDGLRHLWAGRVSPYSLHSLDSAVSEVLRTGGRLTVADLSRRVGCSIRHLERLFREHVGISPKGFSGIMRLHTLQRHLAEGVRAGWPEVALEYGFADQAHMTRAFRAYSGLPPGSFESSEHGAGSRLWLRRDGAP